MGTRHSANNRLTASQSIVRQTRPSWHHCKDTATKVSPSVTERREVTCRIPYQKVLRAKPTLGHTPTHKPGHGTPETHTGTVAALKASTSRQEPCRDRQTYRDSPVMPEQHVAIGKHAATALLITTAKRAAIRSRSTGPTPPLVSRRAEQSRHQ
ncbi:hypothetical protein Taro_011345 [Colocasia esculenta]|uniref:Uncharacterized protein n=1 Tax=Colocasia esculenta TaxID=4460 RepID=A0A843UAM5_COLES|nr:hypothetical protein [Colocasia esculenta]